MDKMKYTYKLIITTDSEIRNLKNDLRKNQTKNISCKCEPV